MPDRKPLSRRKLLKRGLALGTLALAGDAFGVEPNWIEVESAEVPIEGLGKAFDGYRIALFSDVHWPRKINQAYMDRVVAKANAFRPDLVAVPGDLCDLKGVRDGRVPSMRGVFDGLRARDGVVATLGNHDHSFDLSAMYREIADHTPLEIVENRHRLLRRGGDLLAVGGVEDLWFGHADPVRAFEGLPADVPRILLSHNPDVAEDRVWPTRIDLQLSGHTHGGEVRVPFGPALKVPSKYGQKFREGLAEGRSHRVYVTRGVCSCHRARFFCRPEVTHLTLRAA